MNAQNVTRSLKIEIVLQGISERTQLKHLNAWYVESTLSVNGIFQNIKESTLVRHDTLTVVRKLTNQVI